MELEAKHWFSRERHGQVLVVVTDGPYERWPEIKKHLVPPSVREGLIEEPVVALLQKRRGAILAESNGQELREAVTEDLQQVLLRIHNGSDWGLLRGEERSQRRRAIGLIVG